MSRRTSLRSLEAAAAITLVLALAGAPAPARAGGRDATPAQCEYAEVTDVPTTMRDGTVLRSNVFTPTGEGPYPVLLLRLPYNKDVAQTYVYAQPGWYASHCYIVVVQDVRGQYKSDGPFYTFKYEAEDGYDTIEWAAGLPKSNGKVGMYGFSYPGATQLLPAALQPPHLKAIVPAMTSSEYYEGWTYEGGALDLSFAEDWPLTTIAYSHVLRYPDADPLRAEMEQAVKDEFTKTYWYLPLITFPPLHPEDERVAPYFYDWLRHPNNDEYWRQWAPRERYDQITVPALHFDGWWDIFIRGALENFDGLRERAGSKNARRNQQLVVGPWVHIPWGRQVGAIDFGPGAENPIDALQLRWFDHWLKGIDNDVERDAPVRIFVMGANKWRTADAWPLPGTLYRNYYLQSGGNANTAGGDGQLTTKKPGGKRGPNGGASATDTYRYDPADPVPSLCGRFQASVPGGPCDQRPVLDRKDVLVYTTEPLDKDVEVTGPITVTLWASSSARDTDFVAKLDDVYPDATSMLVEYGIRRARYRNTTSYPSLIEPGKIYRYEIEVWPTSQLFKAGHRIRLEITSSNFPMWDRNLNTGGPFAQESTFQTADQVIYHDADHPSSITLPIVPYPIDERRSEQLPLADDRHGRDGERADDP